MSRLTLHWALREEDGPSGRNLARKALAADDPVAFLEEVRNEAWRPPDDRWWAADMLQDHILPREGIHSPSVWHADHLWNKYEIEAQRRMGRYDLPTDDDGESLDGYHHGGLHFPEIQAFRTLTCPTCHHAEEFWDFTRYDAGETHEPDLQCPGCGWDPSEPAYV